MSNSVVLTVFFVVIVLATMILTLRMDHRKYLSNLQEVRYIGTKGYIKVGFSYE